MFLIFLAIYSLFFHPLQQCNDSILMDPQSEQYLNKLNARPFPYLEEWDLKELRNLIHSNPYQSDRKLAKIEDVTIPVNQGTIPLRIYVPFGQGPFPVFVTYHGGGWIFGNLNTHDPFCREIAHEAHCIVVSVDYRLAPEHKFPIPLMDCYQATLWVKENISQYQGDGTNLVISGDSAGGNLAAAVALMARNQNSLNLKGQVLIYPVIDYAFNTPSYQKYSQGFFLKKKDMQWCWHAYLNNEEEGKNPYASPIQARNLNNLPPTLMILAHFDPLHDEGVNYAQKLESSNVPTVVKCFPSIHSFVDFSSFLDIGKESLHEIAQFLTDTFKK